MLHADARTFDWDAPHRRVGGALAPAPAGSDGAVALRIYVDHSAVEVFTGGGQALATRRARHTLTLTLPHAHLCDHSAVEVFTGGGQALATRRARETLTLTCHMCIYLDHSTVEVFTGGGQALATRRARHTLNLTLPHAHLCGSSRR